LGEQLRHPEEADLLAAMAAGLSICWLGAAPARVAERGFGAGAGMTLETVSVEGTAPGPRTDGAPEALTLTVRHGGLLIPCEFRGAKAPRDVQVGDVVTVRRAGWRAEGEADPVLLRDCELVEESRLPGE
jgi:hypothetical protein